MKPELGSDYFLIAHVDLEQVTFGHAVETNIDFIHEIDAWDRLAFNLRSAKKKIKNKTRKKQTKKVRRA